METNFFFAVFHCGFYEMLPCDNTLWRKKGKIAVKSVQLRPGLVVRCYRIVYSATKVYEYRGKNDRKHHRRKQNVIFSLKSHIEFHRQ